MVSKWLYPSGLEHFCLLLMFLPADWPYSLPVHDFFSLSLGWFFWARYTHFTQSAFISRTQWWPVFTLGLRQKSVTALDIVIVLKNEPNLRWSPLVPISLHTHWWPKSNVGNWPIIFQNCLNIIILVDTELWIRMNNNNKKNHSEFQQIQILTSFIK